jgi:hypothetical protein
LGSFLNCSIFLPAQPVGKGGDRSQRRLRARDDVFVIGAGLENGVIRAGKWQPLTQFTVDELAISMTSQHIRGILKEY